MILKRKKWKKSISQILSIMWQFYEIDKSKYPGVSLIGRFLGLGQVVKVESIQRSEGEVGQLIVPTLLLGQNMVHHSRPVHNQASYVLIKK